MNWIPGLPIAVGNYWLAIYKNNGKSEVAYCLVTSHHRTSIPHDYYLLFNIPLYEGVWREDQIEGKVIGYIYIEPPLFPEIEITAKLKETS